MVKDKKAEMQEQETAENIELKEEETETVEEIEIEEEKELTLEEQLEKLEDENAQLQDKILRVAAEFENFRRRSATEKSNWIKNANQRLVLELCDVNDNFERAFENEAPDLKTYQKGIEMIHKQISGILKREGVEKIEVKDAEFDPVYHEALAHIPSDLDENMIAAVIQNGYKMNDKVIRAARVAVSNGVKPEGSAPKKQKKKKK